MQAHIRAIREVSISSLSHNSINPSLTFMQRALNERGIDKMLKEVRDDNRENDAEHMKPVSQSSLNSEVRAEAKHCQNR